MLQEYVEVVEWIGRFALGFVVIILAVDHLPYMKKRTLMIWVFAISITLIVVWIVNLLFIDILKDKHSNVKCQKNH